MFYSQATKVKVSNIQIESCWSPNINIFHILKWGLITNSLIFISSATTTTKLEGGTTNLTEQSQFGSETIASINSDEDGIELMAQ